MNPIVSIVIPVFDTEQYVDETIRSAVSQTYENIEIIIVDDGSTDHSSTICDDWMARDSRIAVYHTANSGLPATRNYAIRRSRGQYILPLDSDDIIAPNYVEKAVAIMSDDDEMGIVYCRAEYFGGRSGEWILPNYSVPEMLIRNCIFCSAMFRRDDYELVGGYCEDMKKGLEDYDFWLSIIQLNRKVCEIPEVMFYYRIRNNSMVQTIRSTPGMYQSLNSLKFTNHLDLYEEAYELLETKNKVILYGAGGAGKTYYSFMKSKELCNVIKWVDRKHEDISLDDYDLMIDNPESIFQCENDAIVIAINDLVSVQKVVEWLEDRGYDKNNIYWYIKQDFYKKYFHNWKCF